MQFEFFAGDSELITSESKFYNEFQKKRASLKAVQQQKEPLKDRKEINKILALKKNWGNKFSDYCQANKDLLLNKHHFLALVDMETCKEAIENGEIRDLVEFRHGLRLIYNFINLYEFFSEDLENLNTLNEYVKGIHYSSHAKEINRAWLLQQLAEYKENMNNQKD
jgi:hypothetical protein